MKKSVLSGFKKSVCLLLLVPFFTACVDESIPNRNASTSLADERGITNRNAHTSLLDEQAIPNRNAASSFDDEAITNRNAAGPF